MKQIPFYLETWFIALVFAFSSLGYPIVAGLLLLYFRYQLDKENSDSIGKGKLNSLETQINIKRQELETLTTNIQKATEMVKVVNDVVRVREERDKAETEVNMVKGELNRLLTEVEEVTGLIDLNEARKELDDRYKQSKKTLGVLDDLSNLDERKNIALEDLKRFKEEHEEVLIELDRSRLELMATEDIVLLQTVGLYKPKFDLQTSEAYASRLDEIREDQKRAIKSNIATIHRFDWVVGDSYEKGRALNNNNIKLILRAFNNDCDLAVKNVKYGNVTAMEMKIKRSREQINRLGKHMEIEISDLYLGYKLDELYLAYEYAQMKEEEKEEQRQIREQMREEKLVQQEIEKQRKKLKKDEQHHKQALANYNKQLENATADLRKDLEAKIREVELRIGVLRKEQEDVDYRERNAKAGYVYIISNIGSFGEDVYKIGMTRRLEPEDRIRELSGASVPFKFDVHAMIFADDAPALETALHKEFTSRRVNKINERKEFFNVSLDEIESVVSSKHNKVVEFTKLAEAQDWRGSQELLKQRTSDSKGNLQQILS